MAINMFTRMIIVPRRYTITSTFATALTSGKTIYAQAIGADF